MTTTILEPPIRVLKLTEGSNKLGAANALSPPITATVAKISAVYDKKQSETQTEKAILFETEKYTCGFDDTMIHDTIDRIAHTLREPIAEVQEKRGIPRDYRFSFVDLMTAMLQHSYTACVSMLTMMLGLVPLLEGLLTLVRFSLDKIIEINDTVAVPEKLLKTLLFIGELIVIFIMVSLILTVILLPIFHLIRYSWMKIWGIVRS